MWPLKEIHGTAGIFGKTPACLSQGFLAGDLRSMLFEQFVAILHNCPVPCLNGPFEFAVH